MRFRYLLPTGLIILLAVGGGVTAHAASDRQTTFTSAAARLRAEWTADQRQGVPTASLAPLRAQLDAGGPTAPWWSPNWFSNDGGALISRLQAATQAAWNTALDAQRSRAETVIEQWSTFATQQAAWIDPSVTASAAQWPQQLATVSSPDAVAALIASWQATTTQQQTAVIAAQTARLDTELLSAGGPQAVLAAARRLVATAAADNLDAGNVAALADTLSSEIASHGDATATAGQLLTAVTALQSLVALNNQVAGQLRPLLMSIDQAAAEGTPSAVSFSSQLAAVNSQTHAARTSAQLSAVQGTIAALQSQVKAELAANQCGHTAVGSGRVITISLSLQEMVFYQDGCAVQATAVSTGRPQLRTPTGTFHIFYKKTPFTFISPWPPSSPFYYYPSPVSWVMEFAADGYFIHDAPWESAGSYGPGSENNLAAASHGCVHTPGSVMQWAFSWTPVGAPVLISA
jgi:lipoprotein-anchoring transpeptidase ErfK/SrfK